MSRLFSHFPSVNDLLESAPLKGVVDRVGRNRVVSETARFLDRMRQQAQSAAQQAFHFTTNELAQRVARWIAASAPSGQRSIINATGVLLPGDMLGPPLATEAIDAMAHTAGAFQLGDQQAAATSLLQRLTGAESALVFSSPPAAMLAAFAGLAQGRRVVLRRGHLERDPHETPLDELARTAGAAIHEVGSINATTTSDYEQGITDDTAAIVSVALRHSVLESANRPDLGQLAAIASRRSFPLIADLGWSGIVDAAPYGLTGLTTARKARESGAGLVLLRGHGLIGGPACGILLGSSPLLERVEKHPFAQAALAAAPVLAALTATLQLYEEASLAERSIPLLTLLSTSSENLKLRAERMAPQMAAVTAIASAEAVETLASLSGRKAAEEELSGYGIALVPQEGSPAELAAQLLAGTQAVAAKIENERVLLDLRSVAPKYDLALVDAVSLLAGTTEPSPAL